jgi:2-polyprenyl-6-methoxyphenol hydroxylase-like FAD-dependent oxidoreductase
VNASLDRRPDVIVIGAGIGGLTLALALHQAQIPCCLVEAVPQIKPLGVGINLLPHAVAALSRLGLLDALERRAVATREVCYYTRRGQLVHKDPRGRWAGYDVPQLSIHRADLHEVLLGAVRQRLGPGAVELGCRCTGIAQDGEQVNVQLQDSNGNALAPVHGSLAIACDGVHSVVRKQLHPVVGARPRYEGTTQYRGTTRSKPFLTGASMVYLGTQQTGKLVLYPVRNDVDGEGRQLLNWVVEVERPDELLVRDWNRPASADAFIAGFENCLVDGLDVPAMMRAADAIYEYPMVDQDPLPFWSQGRVTLLGDAAHPMMPRGSNGSAQAILDALTLADVLAANPDPIDALKVYEARRLPATSEVVLANRRISPDAILRVVEERTGGAPFANIEDVLTKAEFDEWQARYRHVAGFAKQDLASPRGS